MLADDVNTQEFQVSCDRQVDPTNGIITAIFSWTIVPLGLPFSPLEALELIDVRISNATLMPDGNFTREGSRFSLNQAEEGERRVEIIKDNQTLVTAVITLDRNGSGSVVLEDLAPSNQDSPNALQFQVRV